MPSITWSRETAAVYDRTSADMFEPHVVDPVVDTLFALASGGQALEFAIGTGRIGLPLSRRGIRVCGIELSPHMIEQLRRKPEADSIEVTIGDMATTRIDGEFVLVYLVFNTIMNVTSQEEQIAVFANAAAHLVPGGVFVVEVLVPQLRHPSPNDLGRVFTLRDDHVGIETFDDVEGQISTSHHWMHIDGRLVRESSQYRYVWPSELDLMARLAGLRLRDRWSGWKGEEFTDSSTDQVAVYEKFA